MTKNTQPRRVVVLGGGFAGLTAAKTLRRAPVEITLVDRRNHHVFQPLLYQVATGTLSPANVCAPLRSVLARQHNARVILSEVMRFDPVDRVVELTDGQLMYDALIVACGSLYNYFGKPWQSLAPSLKSVEDATEIRRRILLTFERAELEESPLERRRLLTFVIVGGGPTGVELAGALAEIARHTIASFRRIQPGEPRIVLVEAIDRVLTQFPQDLSAKAARSLERLGVEIKTGCKVTNLEPDALQIRCGDALHSISGACVFWTAGVRASPIAAALADATGAKTDKIGRIVVEPDLTIAGYPEIFVVGDMAHFEHHQQPPLPGLAPVAIQQGRHAAKMIKRRLKARATLPFKYRDRGTMATIGRSAAVADLHWARFNGFLAWIVWLFVHLMQLVTFENRLLVFVQWAWHYLTFSHNAQLITETRAEQQRRHDEQHPSSSRHGA